MQVISINNNYSSGLRRLAAVMLDVIIVSTAVSILFNLIFGWGFGWPFDFEGGFFRISTVSLRTVAYPSQRN